MKWIIIAAAVYAFYWFIKNQLSATKNYNQHTRLAENGYVLIDSSIPVVSKTLKKCLSNSIIGIVLLLATVLFFAKLKVLLFLIPIGVYLLGDLIIFLNHYSLLKKQKIWYNARQNEVYITTTDHKKYHFNLLRDVNGVQQIDAIQASRGLQLGYYRLKIGSEILQIPLMIAQHKTADNTLFFDTLHQNFDIDKYKKIFPVIY